MTTNTDGSHYVVDDWNERDAKKRASNNWRASLVPAAAVIPAPRVYTKAVAVKKLVVNFRNYFKRCTCVMFEIMNMCGICCTYKNI